MHLRSISAIARKDALDLVLNKGTLFALLTPIFLAIIFAFVANLVGTNTSDLLIYNPSGSALEAAISQGFTNPHIIHVASPADIAAKFGPDGTLKKSTYTLGLVIPPNFDAALRAGQNPQVELFTNGDDINAQEHGFLLATITTYARHVVAPQDPLTITSDTINPPSQNDVTKNLNKFYAMGAAMSAFMVGISIIPSLMIEEKEKKTLRMLLVSPASLADIVVAKILVGFGYLIVLTLVALTITNGFFGQIPLLLLFAMLGVIMALALGLLAGSVFQTSSATGAFGGIVGLLFLVPIFVVDFASSGTSGNSIAQALKLLPTYYLADGMFAALNGTTTTTGLATDLAVVAGTIAVFIAAAVYALRRQSAVLATI